MKFTHLHCHSEYSLLDGLPKVSELVAFVKKLGMDSVALTDHGNLYGAVEFYKAAKKEKIKPIIGCEMYLARDSMEKKRPGIDNKNYHIVLLVKNEIGYKNLVKLITLSHLKGFYYKPRIDEKTLFENSEGLICLTGCLQGKIPKLILAKKIEEAKKTAQKYQEVFGKDNFYLEIQPHKNIPEQLKVNKTLTQLSKELKIPLVATNDSHYLRKEDAKIQDVLMLINTGQKPDDPERLTMKMDDFSIRKPEEMIEFFKDVPEAIENTQKIVSLCNFEFKLGKVRLPKFNVPENLKPEEYLEKLALNGLKQKEKEFENLSKAKQRLKYELEVIKKTGFSSYFLIVQDFVNWAKKERIVTGPGRGSVGGSLVAYLIGITNINPLKYNLLFERFLNPERISMPDIDIDFTDRRRQEVIEYISEKYGKDRVAQICTFGRMAARAVVRDVGRALQYPYSYCDKIAKMIPFGLSLDETLSKVPEFREIYLQDPKAQKLIDIAKKLEGVARHLSTHACGVVISDKPLTEIVPLQHPSQSDNTIVTQYEMHSIEDLGLLKIDILGLKNLTIIEETLNRIYAIHGKNVDIENIPLSDSKTFKLFQNAETIGVFQLESEGMRNWLKQLKPTKIEDIIALLALYRPGPMQFIRDYIKGKQNKKSIKYLHPKLKPILEPTYGVLVYQEQLMKIAQELAGFSLSEADVLRKAVGKKIKSLLESQKEKFIKGCIKNKIKKDVAQKIWNWILPFARYGFNKAHSTAYALIAYQTAYLKSHYPVEFMAALLTSEKDDVERIGFLISEAKRMGIDVLGPDINESFRNFSVIPDKKKIRFGLLAIKNVGHNVVEAIISERKKNGKFKTFSDFIARIDSKDLNKKSLEALIKSGAFDRFGDRNQFLKNIEKILAFNREIRKQKSNGQKDLFSQKTNNNLVFELKLEIAEKTSEKQKLIWERELLGLYISSHPLKKYQKILDKKTIKISQISEFLEKKVKVGGIISQIKRILTRNGKTMLFINLEDLSGKTEIIVFPGVFEDNIKIFKKDKVVLISGKVDNKNGSPKIIAETIEEIIEE